MTYGDNSSDEELMLAFALEDNLRAFETLYKRLSPKVYGYLRLRLQNSEDVDEVFQKVFAKLHSKRSSYNQDYRVLQWIFVIAKSTLLDHLKSAKRKANLKEAIKNSEPLSQNDTHSSLSEQMNTNLLKGLSTEAQAVVQLRVIDELEFDEISKLLGKSEASVRQILSRSIKKLRLSFGGGE